MSPRGPSRAPKYRKHTTPKTLKNHCFFLVFGGPRPSKTASKDPKRLPRGYLGLLEAILSHLGAILKTRAFKRAPAGWDRAAPFPKYPILGPFWGVFWDQIGPRRGQDEPKRAIESFKYPKTCICKNLKKPLFFQGFWSPEASQRSLKRPKKAPRRHPKKSKTSKKGIQNWTPNLTSFGPI